jgi:hypothetical protein
MAASAEAAVENLEKEISQDSKPKPASEPAREAVDTGPSTSRADSVTEDVGGDLQIDTGGNENVHKGEQPILTNTVK